MTPVGLARGLARSAVGTAVHTALHPVSTAAQAVGLARGAVHAVSMAPGIIADTVAHRSENRAAPVRPTTAAPERETAPESSPPGPEAEVDPADSVPVVHDDHEPAPATPGVPDLDPPDPADRVLVVEEALAAEAAEQTGQVDSRFGVVTEPHASTRDEDHGQARLRPAEVEEIAEEAEARE